ncbi:MAG TPA: NAD-dependent succinate-semialdehyde dehydrogenase [Coxiellaceae bacterium]|nr:NAD-dependent succinate-semialdehyde dehydrogenase [Coxiellaceae bacterium]
MNIDIINPTTGKLLKSYPTLLLQQVGEFIEETSQAQKSWKHTSFSERKQCMLHAATLLRTHQMDYATLITQEMGKPITQAKAEIDKCARVCEYYAEQAEGYLAPIWIPTEHSKTYQCFNPLGIVLAIMPWNFPFWQVFRFAAPNLMAGNACLLKHAHNSVGASLAIQEIFERAGFPNGLFRSLIIDVDLVPAVIEHSAIAGVTLTGSERAGSVVASQAGKALKKIVVELGGNDPYLILEDADIQLAVEQCVQSRLSNAGQVCIAAKRILVVESIYDTFVKALKHKMIQYSCGDPMDPNTTIGPLACEDLRKRIHDQVNRCIKEGAECVMGGELPPGEGFFYPPTLLLNITPKSPVFTEELFGPVVCIIKVKDEGEGILLANETRFGLGAAVFTRDIARGERIACQELEAGTCNVNSFVTSDPHLPFGGIKSSGFGRELGADGIRAFMNIKTVVVG